MSGPGSGPAMAEAPESPRRLRVLLAQLNTVVGDIAGNTERMIDVLQRARDADVHVAVFPELAITGYPPEDLLLRPSFLADAEAAVHAMAAHTVGLTALVGYPDRRGDLHNAAAVLHDGQAATVVRKVFLPNYSVFDEERYFRAGGEAIVFRGHDARFGVSICEDIWYPTGPPEMQARAGAEVLINLSASPYVRGKSRQRERMLATRAADNLAFVVYCNLVGGQDELVFDGNSLVIGPTGDILARGASFDEDLFIVELNLDQVFHERLLDPRERKARWVEEERRDVRWVSLPPLARRAAMTAPGRIHRGPGAADAVAAPIESAADLGADSNVAAPFLSAESITSSSTPSAMSDTAAIEIRGGAGPGTMGGADGSLSRGPEPLRGLAEIWAALVLGTRDYVHKNGFREVVIGLSGGIDSALCATIAADALGAQRVVGVGMPSRYSSPSSLADARALAELRGMRFLEVPIDDVFQAYLDMLAPSFAEREPDVTEENLQSRIRGNIGMALSNKFGWMVITTGNKSETSVGYSTLYGDTAGGFAPIKDVSKLLVYELSRWRNTWPDGPVIPEHSITRAPSAELRPDQTDQDSLPPYEILDPILVAYVEEEMSVEEIAAMGYERALVDRIARLVDRAEYKRRQAPPGIKISGRAFGRDRRMPITKRVTRLGG